MKPAVSVIVPVYNAAATLPRCVDSLLAQEYADMEILLVDDGSRDGSAELCDRLAADDARICAVHQPNGGASAARNTGLERAQGRYLHFVDADDEVDPGLYARAVPAMDEGGLDAFVFACHAPGSDAPLDTLPDIEAETLAGLDGAFVRESILHTGIFSAPYNKLFRRQTVQAQGLCFDEKLLINEDFRFNLLFFARARRLRLCPQTYYCYHTDNAASLSRRLRTDLLRSARHNRDAVTAFAAAAGLAPEATADRYEAACAVRQFYLLVGRDGDAATRRAGFAGLLGDEAARAAVLAALHKDPNRAPALLLTALVRLRAAGALTALVQARREGSSK